MNISKVPYKYKSTTLGGPIEFSQKVTVDIDIASDIYNCIGTPFRICKTSKPSVSSNANLEPTKAQLQIMYPTFFVYFFVFTIGFVKVTEW